MNTKRDIIISIVTLARLIKTEADKRARTHGMTRAQWGILINLDRHPGLLQKELAEILEVEPITVARLVDRLEARGMVERRADPSDRRCWRLHLRGPALPLLREIDAQLSDLASICLAGLDEPAIATLQATLAPMREAMAAEAKRSPVPPPESIEAESAGGAALNEAIAAAPAVEAVAAVPAEEAVAAVPAEEAVAAVPAEEAVAAVPAAGAI